MADQPKLQNQDEEPIIRAHKDEFERLKHTLAVVERIAMLAVHRLGGTMRITDQEWASAENGDIQWRTIRPPPNMTGLQPEIHVACTLIGETQEVGGDKPVHNAGNKPN